jgi:hypothetical protein
MGCNGNCNQGRACDCAERPITGDRIVGLVALVLLVVAACELAARGAFPW